MKYLNRFLAGLCIIALTGAVIASQRAEQRAEAEGEALLEAVRRKGVGERFAGDTLPTAVSEGSRWGLCEEQEARVFGVR